MVVAKHVHLHGTERSPDYYKCLCGSVHVHRGAYIIAIIGLIFSTISLINTAFFGQFYALPVPIISFLLFLGVLLAHNMEKPGLYLPYIIINVLCILVTIGLAIFVIVTGATVSAGGYVLANKEENKQTYGYLGVATIISGSILIIWSLINVYFVHVVYRAYRYMKDVVHNPTATLTHVGEV